MRVCSLAIVLLLWPAAPHAAPAPPPPMTVLVRRGEAPERWVHFTVEVQGRQARLVGCETVTRTLACRRTRKVELAAAQLDELARLWAAIQKPGLACRVKISMADWQPFELTWRGGQRPGRLPPRFISLLPRCLPHAHLVWWLLERWGNPGRSPG